MKIALVTGGSKGIGLETVRRFVAKGYVVISCARNEDTWLEKVLEFPELKPVDFHVVDISNLESVKEFFGYISGKYKKIDISVNNASPKTVSTGAFQSVQLDHIFETFNVDLISVAACMHYELNLSKSGASIVNLSSINGIKPCSGASAYSAAKYGLEGLTKSVALEAIKNGVRVNSVAPGVTWTPRWLERTKDNPELKNSVEAAVPIKRFATAQEIVNAIEWLSSDQASYIVGHTLVVDGGLAIS